MTADQRASAIAAGIQAAARDRKAEQSAGGEGLLRAFSRTAWNAVEAPFQLATNAIGYGMGKAAGDQPDGVGIGDVFTNTDIGSQVYGLQDGGQPGSYGDQGDGWFTDPMSPAAKMKEGLDNDVAGGLGASLGQRLTNSLQLEKGTAPYSILSGAVDASSRVLDPSMYVGAGEASRALRAMQGIDATNGARVVNVGSAAAAAE